MRSYVGRVLRGDNVLLENVHVYLTVTEPSESRTGKWRGSFSHAEACELISVGARFSLTLKDGRSGEIVVSKIGASESIAPIVFFEGVGPFG
jgi:hypothetical protein